MSSRNRHHQEQHLEEDPEDVAVREAHHHHGKQRGQDGVERAGSDALDGRDCALPGAAARLLEHVGDVCRVIHGEAHANQEVDCRDTADGDIPEVHEAKGVNDGQSHAENHPDGNTWRRHQGKDDHQDHAATDEKVSGQLHVDDAHFLPVEEVEAVREGARVKLVAPRAHGGHGVVAVGALVRGRQRQLGVEAACLQPISDHAAAGYGLGARVQVAGGGGPNHGAAVAGSRV